ncbi:MAG: AbrB/MazE/SpoVT family DNA-binding domain-containing protein [Nanoarchaeota archaeon]
MKIETTKMSSRGQIVIPQNVREEIEANEGTIFIVMTSGDTLLLKKVETPSKQEVLENLEKMAKEGEKIAEKAGIKERDVANIVRRFRESKRKK